MKKVFEKKPPHSQQKAPRMEMDQDLAKLFTLLKQPSHNKNRILFTLDVLSKKPNCDKLINVQNEYNHTLLIEACYNYADFDIISKIFQLKADPNITTTFLSKGRNVELYPVQIIARQYVNEVERILGLFYSHATSTFIKELELTTTDNPAELTKIINEEFIKKYRTDSHHHGTLVQLALSCHRFKVALCLLDIFGKLIADKTNQYGQNALHTAVYKYSQLTKQDEKDTAELVIRKLIDVGTHLPRDSKGYLRTDFQKFLSQTNETIKKLVNDYIQKQFVTTSASDELYSPSRPSCEEVKTALTVTSEYDKEISRLIESSRKASKSLQGAEIDSSPVTHTEMDDSNSDSFACIELNPPSNMDTDSAAMSSETQPPQLSAMPSSEQTPYEVTMEVTSLPPIKLVKQRSSENNFGLSTFNSNVASLNQDITRWGLFIQSISAQPEDYQKFDRIRQQQSAHEKPDYWFYKTLFDKKILSSDEHKRKFSEYFPNDFKLLELEKLLEFNDEEFDVFIDIIEKNSEYPDSQKALNNLISDLITDETIKISDDERRLDIITSAFPKVKPLQGDIHLSNISPPKRSMPRIRNSNSSENLPITTSKKRKTSADIGSNQNKVRKARHTNKIKEYPDEIPQHILNLCNQYITTYNNTSFISDAPLILKSFVPQPGLEKPSIDELDKKGRSLYQLINTLIIKDHEQKHGKSEAGKDPTSNIRSYNICLVHKDYEKAPNKRFANLYDELLTLSVGSIYIRRKYALDFAKLIVEFHNKKLAEKLSSPNLSNSNFITSDKSTESTVITDEPNLDDVLALLSDPEEDSDPEIMQIKIQIKAVATQNKEVEQRLEEELQERNKLAQLKSREVDLHKEIAELMSNSSNLDKEIGELASYMDLLSKNSPRSIQFDLNMVPHQEFKLEESDSAAVKELKIQLIALVEQHMHFSEEITKKNILLDQLREIAKLTDMQKSIQQKIYQLQLKWNDLIETEKSLAKYKDLLATSNNNTAGSNIEPILPMPLINESDSNAIKAAKTSLITLSSEYQQLSRKVEQQQCTVDALKKVQSEQRELRRQKLSLALQMQKEKQLQLQQKEQKLVNEINVLSPIKRSAAEMHVPTLNYNPTQFSLAKNSPSINSTKQLNAVNTDAEAQQNKQLRNL